MTPEAEVKLTELKDITDRINVLEDELGSDPRHRRNDDSEEGLYQKRLRLYLELKALDIGPRVIAKAAGTTPQSVRALIAKQRANHGT